MFMRIFEIVFIKLLVEFWLCQVKFAEQEGPNDFTKLSPSTPRLRRTAFV